MIKVNNTRRAINIILVCNAILFSYVETFVPLPFPVPGLKLGLANIITIIAIVFLNYKDVVFIVVFRCMAMAFLAKGIIALVLSLSAGFLSATVMWFLYTKAYGIFSIRGISIAGAIVHNVVQVIIASIILGENILFCYLPILLIASVITGFFIGFIGELAVKQIQKKGLLYKCQNS